MQTIEKAVEQFASLPGVGRKTALRFVLNLLKRSGTEIGDFADALNKLATETKFCERCHNIADDKLCSVCKNTSRNQQTICVVADIRDIMAIESTQQYNGVYHVLGGVLSPMEGVGPANLNIASLLERVQQEKPSEIVLALNSTMEGDTTSFYLFKKLSDFPVKVTTLARGLPVGDDLEYADEITLGRSIQHRIPYQGK
ncbi:MAG: recombination mediator RecR [Luteibaculaceae bacterium]